MSRSMFCKTDDKGSVLGWLNVIEAHNKLGLELLIGLVCCFEGMEESGSLGLDGLIEKETKALKYPAFEKLIVSKPSIPFRTRGSSELQYSDLIANLASSKYPRKSPPSNIDRRSLTSPTPWI